MPGYNMGNISIVRRLASGAAAGAVATIALQQLRAVSHRKLPNAKPPMRLEPGKFMVKRAESVMPSAVQEKIPETAESIAARLLSLGYGMSFGALYSLVRPRGGSPIVDGAALGAGTWAVGYLGWLPATGLMPPIRKQRTAQVLVPLAEHVLFGVAAVAGYALLGRRLRDKRTSRD
jgi:hypothetical protein